MRIPKTAHEYERTVGSGKILRGISSTPFSLSSGHQYGKEDNFQTMRAHVQTRLPSARKKKVSRREAAVMACGGLATAGPGRPGAVPPAPGTPPVRTRGTGQSGEESAHADPVTLHPLGQLAIGIPRGVRACVALMTRPNASSGKILLALTDKAAMHSIHECRRDGVGFSIVRFAIAWATAREGSVSTRRVNHRAESVRTSLDRVP